MNKKIENKKKDSRLEFFKNEILPLLHEEYNVIEKDAEKQYIIHTNIDGIGKITVFPKGNIHQIHANKKHYWEMEFYRNDSIQWCLDNLLKDELVSKKYQQFRLEVFGE